MMIMGKLIDLTGMRFGKWTVISRAEPGKYGATRWNCLCDCGNIRTVVGTSLRIGDSTQCKSCWAEEQNKKHGYTSERFGKRREKLYEVWAGIKYRCNNPNMKYYDRYGGRGISVCAEWEEYSVFREWALSHGYKEGLSINRIDNDGNYCPENCEWTSAKEQANNRSNNRNVTFNGETHSIAEWARISGIADHILRVRIRKYKWDVEKAFTTPVKNSKRGAEKSQPEV
jgi:hypothetical protein